MKIGTAIAIYFVVWWIVLFAILPWRVKNAHEAGEAVLEGNEPGAPIEHQLGKKALVTTVVAGLVFALIYFTIEHFWSWVAADGR
jgi:predicted secreted protein